MAAKRNQKKPEIKIVFDTSVLYTKAESFLLRKEIAEVISENNKHNDIEIGWYLPEVVKHERQYQMLRKSLELLPSIEKLEILLGHKLNITEEIIRNRVMGAVEKQLNEYRIQVINLEHPQVDWGLLIHSAVYRLPPFDPGEKEKGFRDALVAEAFLQLVRESPVTPKSCRLVLVSDDQLLRDSIAGRLDANVKNVKLLPTIEELKGFINTLVSEADEEFINSVQQKSDNYFFEKGNSEGLYFKEGIRNKISQEFESQLKETPEGADLRENETWYISDPQFVKKEGQRIYFVSRIRVAAKLYTLVSEDNKATSDDVPRRRTLSDFAIGTTAVGAVGLSRRSLTARPKFDKVETGSGSTKFDVQWSVSVSTTTKSFSKPLINGISFVETSWEQ